MEVRNLLLVENDRGVLRALARMLRSEGYVTWTVPSVEAALRLPLEFEAGVFDIELDDGDGVALARRLRDEGRVRRVVFFTGCVDPERLREARSVGEVVVKGSSSRILVEALVRAERRPQGPEATDPWIALELEIV